jgi:hypothetical protein
MPGSHRFREAELIRGCREAPVAGDGQKHLDARQSVQRSSFVLALEPLDSGLLFPISKHSIDFLGIVNQGLAAYLALQQRSPALMAGDQTGI